MFLAFFTADSEKPPDKIILTIKYEWVFVGPKHESDSHWDKDGKPINYVPILSSLRW